MPTTVDQLVEILSLFFPGTYSARNALLALGTVALLVPLLELHNMQHRRSRQPQRTAWLDAIYLSFSGLLRRKNLPNTDHSSREIHLAALSALSTDLQQVSDLLDLASDNSIPLLGAPSYLLLTSHRTCIICPTDNESAPHVLYRHDEPQRVQVVLPSFERRTAVLLSARCKDCMTIYYPDRLSIRQADDPQTRMLRLEPSPRFIRISKPDKLWAHCDLMRVQSSAFTNLYCGWSSFSKFMRNSAPVVEGTILNERQAKRMFAEHFGRRLLIAHNKIDDFRCPLDPDTDELMGSIVEVLGSGQGLAPDGVSHRCAECTHKKRYAMVDANPAAANHQRVLGVSEREQRQAVSPEDAQDVPIPRAMPAASAEEDDDDDSETVVNMVVIDGKVIQHWICAVPTCTGPLMNYKNGRFCKNHIQLADVCAIAACNNPVTPGSLVCGYEPHENWYTAYEHRFGRLSYQGVRRVIRHQVRDRELGGDGVQARVQLPPIDGLAGNEVPHTIRPRSVHGIQTAQWACGYPVGWTKLYGSESLSQVYNFLVWIWPDRRTRPTFVAYDNACQLLRHIITSHFEDGWLQVSRFVVDAWHYINHVSDDDICRVWCNPAPTDGSQPDLVLEKTDADGTTHQVRAFNLETAEQFNSWLDRYKGLLEQMTATSHDFVMHALFMLYAEITKTRLAEAARKRRGNAQPRRRVQESGSESEDDENL